jgi:hypothetical protein
MELNIFSMKRQKHYQYFLREPNKSFTGNISDAMNI